MTIEKKDKPRTDWERDRDEMIELAASQRDDELEMSEWYDNRGETDKASWAAGRGRLWHRVITTLRAAKEPKEPKEDDND
jgi:hypothetical protein